MATVERSLSVVIPRERLLAQLQSAQPRILSIVAPAGFGKSTLARQYCQRFDSFAVCDLAGVQSQAEFARVLTSALAGEATERAAELTHLQLSVSEGGPSDADKTDLVIAAWSRPGRATAFIFENTERIDDNASVQEFLWRLLGSIPQSRCVVICSRTPLRARLSRFANPHDIVSLHADQLVFDRQELEAAFVGIDVSSPQIDRVIALSRGWPIAVLLFVRFAREGTLDKVLDHVDDVQFENLHDYLAEQVLAAWSRETVEALGACACIPNATARDVAYALCADDAKGVLDGAVRSSSFITRSHQGIYEIHPLMRSALLEANKDRRAEWLDVAARRWSEQHECARAARLRLEAGDTEGAAAELARMDIFKSQVYSVEYTSVLASIPAEVVARHAVLWYGTVHLRRFRIDNRTMLREARALWPAIASQPFNQRTPVCVFYTYMMSDFGEHERSEEVLRGFARELEASPNPDDVVPYKTSVTHILAAVVARMGRLGEAQADFDLAWSDAIKRPISASVAALNRAALVERVLGRRDAEREWLDIALAHAYKTGFTTMIARVLAESAYCAWFAGDDKAFNRFVLELKDRVERDSIRGLSHFIDCATDGADKTPIGIEEPTWLARAFLVAWSRTADDHQAAEYAARALNAADELREPAVQAITRLALARVTPGRRDELAAQARDFAARVESPALQSAVKSFSANRELGILQPMFETRDRHTHVDRVPPLEIDFLTHSVRRHGKPVELSHADRNTLYSLALGRQVVSAKWLGNTLWPSMDASAAEDSLDHSLMRLRASLGPDAIDETPGGYRLCEGTRVDLWEIEDAASDTRGASSLSDAERGRLHALHDRIRLSDVPVTHHAAVLELTDRRIRELRREIAERLGRDALARHAGKEALVYAREMAEYDRWDQAARELAVQALLMSGDKAGALEEFEEYQQILKHELRTQPSGSMQRHLKQTFGKLMHRDTLFDIGADAVNLLVPGGGIALRIVKAIAAKRGEPTA